MKVEKMRNFAIVTAIAVSLATTLVLFTSTQSVFSYDKKQATSDANVCGNDFLPVNIGCQNTGSQTQGDENGVALTAQQTFPEFLREIPRKIVDGFLTIKTAIVEPFGETDPGQGTDGGLNAFLKTHGLIPVNGEGGAFGYGILTQNTESGDGSLIVATTHAGVLDSETQNDDASDPIWHNHMVRLGTDVDCGADPAVGEISWLQPGNVQINGKTASITDIPNSFTSPTATNPTTTPVEFEPGNVVQELVSFILVPIPSSGGSVPDGDLDAICVTDIKPAPPS